jgi:hypothetical protein
MGAPSNRTATLESQMIPMIQDVPGQTLRNRYGTFRELLRVKRELGLYLNPNGKPVLSVSGYGEYRPVTPEPGETAEGFKQRNRRIDLRILMATPRSEDAKQMQRDLQRFETRP